MLNSQEIDKIAQLARLKLTDKEKTMYAEQLSVVFDYVEMLKEVDTEMVAETCQVTGLEDVFREDEAKTCDADTMQKLIDAFPEKIDNQLRVKNVFENS